MDKMLKKCCMLALAGGMVFGGGCLDLGGFIKFTGRGLAEGAGRSFGEDLTTAFVTRPITVNQDAVNAVNLQEAIADEIAARADADAE